MRWLTLCKEKSSVLFMVATFIAEVLFKQFILLCNELNIADREGQGILDDNWGVRTIIGASLNKPHTSERFHTVNHSQSKPENYENSKYRSYIEPCHEVRTWKYVANSKYGS